MFVVVVAVVVVVVVAVAVATDPIAVIPYYYARVADRPPRMTSPPSRIKRACRVWTIE